MDKNDKLRMIFSALIGASSAVLGLYLPGLLLLPAALGFVAAGWGVRCFAVAVAASLAALLGLFGADVGSALMMVSLYLPSALMLAYTLRGQRPYRTCVAVSGGLVTLALYCILCLPSVLEGNDPFTAFYESLRAYLDAFAAAMGEGDTAAAALQQWQDNLPLVVPQVATITMLGMGLGAGFFNTVIARGLARRVRGVELRPMAPLFRWELSREFTLGAAVLLLGCAAVQWLAITNYEAIVAALLCIVILPFALMGVSFMEFTRRLRGRGKVFMALYAALLVLMLPYSVVAMATLGLMDRIFRFRKKYAGRLPGGPDGGGPMQGREPAQEEKDADDE